MNVIVVTGGAGFIGSNFVLQWLAAEEDAVVINVDKLTYAGNRGNLESVERYARHVFVSADINDGSVISGLLSKYRSCAIVHFAAESHVDRSILGPAEFVRTNIEGTFRLLEEARQFWGGLDGAEREAFRFLHVSTDEVYGSLGPHDPAFTEATPYAPNSPYSASKAASDHLVRAYFHTYGLPVLTTNCSNNYGPRQFPEKLIPLAILNALEGRPIPVYGDGANVRDWLYVEDHCRAIRTVLAHGRLGETYNIGGEQELTNLQVVKQICAVLDELRPVGGKHESLITFVKDRPGHDRRYAMNISRIRTELGWSPQETFASGLRRTVQWYLDNLAWVESVRSGEYQKWYKTQYQGAGA